jgi:glycosyltransferase involved in cell wall biosynthesis
MGAHLHGIIDGVISFCMIAKNEDRDIAACLDSVRGLAGEMIVVDTGSTDRTRAIAAEYGAEVMPFDFQFVDFAAARNYAIEQARGEWILMLDADETLAPGGAAGIEKLAAEGRNAGYFLERVNRSWEAEKPFTDHVVRLFPNRPGIRYRGRVHETVDASILAGGGKLIRTAIRIDHRFRADAEARRRKNLWYIEILKEEIAADPADDSRLDFLAAEYHQLEMFAEATEVAERIVRVRPNDARAHLFVGVYHLLYRPDLPQARADFERALELRPGYPEAESFLKLVEEKERG